MTILATTALPHDALEAQATLIAMSARLERNMGPFLPPSLDVTIAELLSLGYRD